MPKNQWNLFARCAFYYFITSYIICESTTLYLLFLIKSIILNFWIRGLTPFTRFKFFCARTENLYFVIQGNSVICRNGCYNKLQYKAAAKSFLSTTSFLIDLDKGMVWGLRNYSLNDERNNIKWLWLLL